MGEVELPSWLKALPQAPEYHPTEAEFADPVAYILKIEEEAKQYGICKIIPPFTKASKKVVVSNLNRSLYMSTEALSCADHGPCPMSRSMGGAIFGSELSKLKALFLDASCADSSHKAKFATRRQQLGWNPKRARGVSHSQNHKLVWQSGEMYTLEQFEAKAKMFSRSRLGTCKDVSPLAVESLFWRAAAEKPISVEYANDIPGSAFADTGESFSLTQVRLRKRKRALEDGDQLNLGSIFVGVQSEEKVREEEACEERDASDAGKSRNGSVDTSGDNVGGAGSKLASSAWNMRNVARSQGSLLRFMPEEVPGVTSPMVYIGMLFSWFAWHVEDHELHSLNYLHMGASKTWYAVPGDAAPALEEAIRLHGYGGHLDPRASFSLLGEKTTVMSPEVLVAAGVPCCRLVQNAGEYVVTFPRAYHLGFSHGFNCGEAANFATPGWLEVAKEAAARRAAMNYLPMLSHQQLLYLLTMSLPPRMPSSCPSEPRSSRLKVRKKSVGEEMVKSMFLDDAVRNNELLCILLDKGVSRCLLAKDAVHRSPIKAVSEGSKPRSPTSPFGVTDSLQQALISQMRSQGVEASHFLCHRASRAEETEDLHVKCQLPSCRPVPSVRQDTVFKDVSVRHVGDNMMGKLSCQSIDPSSNWTKSLIEEVPHEVKGNAVYSKNRKETNSLAIDWGTLPCAACGILCYATMAVVEPSVTAAMTFKPIFAAAGLGHCAFEADEAGRMANYIPSLSYPRSDALVEGSDEKHVNASHPDCASERVKLVVPSAMVAELFNPIVRQPAADKVVSARHALSTAHDSCLGYLTRKPSDDIRGIGDRSANINFDNKLVASKSGHLVQQASDMCLEKEIKEERDRILVNMELNSSMNNCDVRCVLTQPESVIQAELGLRHAQRLDCATTLGLNAEGLRSGNIDSSIECSDQKDSHQRMSQPHALLEPTTLVSKHQSMDSNIITGVCELAQECGLQPKDTPDSGLVRVDGRLSGAKICGEQERLKKIIVLEQQGVSSLQLLASIYNESSDIEDDNVVQVAYDCNALTEEKNISDEGREVFVKPHSGVGNLLTDVVGLSSDVPWLSLVPVTERTGLPPLNSTPPVFTFSSLVEGPSSLEKVFISGGFAFVEEDDNADPTSLYSSLAEEQNGKHIIEASSIDAGLSNPMTGVHCGDSLKVVDMKELYHRINSQALIVDSDEDEKLLKDFGLRPLRATSLQESLDVMEPMNDATQQTQCLDQFEASNQVQAEKNMSMTLGAPSMAVDNSSLSSLSSLGLPVDNPSWPVLTFIGTPSKKNSLPHATTRRNQIANVDRLHEDSSGDAQLKERIQDTGARSSSGRKAAASKACKSVARPRVLCLEHAVEAQERLRPVGGANVVIVCHSDFDSYELRAKQLANEFGVHHAWRHVPFTEGADDEVRTVTTAVEVEDDGNRLNDWVMQMGLFFHHRFEERESESSDDTQDSNEGFRAGPFSRGNHSKASKNKPMAGRLGLSRKCEDHRRIYSGVSPQMTVQYSRRLTKLSKKKKCMVAGRWCGRVWRVNQVHPFLGGCRTVDPSLQLGMSSTSLYALSMMSECDGGKYRKGISSSRIEAPPNCHLVSDKSAEDQQSIAVRIRGRKRKLLEQGINAQQDNDNDVRRTMSSITKGCPKTTLTVCLAGLESSDCFSSPKQAQLSENRDGSEYLEGAMNGGEEAFRWGERQGQLMLQVVPSAANESDGDLAIQSSKSGITSSHGNEMLSPVPLAARNPSETEDSNNNLYDKNKEYIGEESGAIQKDLPVAMFVGEHECYESTDKQKTVTSYSTSLTGESHGVTDLNALGLSLTPSPSLFRCIQSGTGRSAEDVDDWHKTATLSNVYSALPLVKRLERSRNGSNNSLVASSPPMDGKRICGVSNTACVWRDVPVACARSLHTGKLTSRFAFSVPKSIQNQLYPYTSDTTKEAASDHMSVYQTSNKELHEGSGKTFEQEGTKVEKQNLVGIFEGGAAEADLDSDIPDGPLMDPTTKLYTEINTAVQQFSSSKLVAANGRQTPHGKTGCLRDEGLMEVAVPSLLSGAFGSYLDPNEGGCGRSCTSDLPQGSSQQQVYASGRLQLIQQDIKSVFRLPDCRGKSISDTREVFANTGPVYVCHTEECQSTSDDCDPVDLQDAHHQHTHLHASKQSVELTPVFSIPPSLIEEGALEGNAELGFAHAPELDSSLEHPLGTLLPVQTPSRGRSVKARGKRPKHVGWKNYKPNQSGALGGTSVSNGVLQMQSHIIDAAIFTSQPNECVEARFEVEDCDRVLEIRHRSTSPMCPISRPILHQLKVEENDEEDNSKSEKVVVKAKKKGKLKKKRIPLGKPTVEEGEFHCDIDGCRMSFPTDTDLQIHKRNRCTVKGCGKRFFMHKYLLQHRRVHLDERPLKCPWKGCKQAFKWAWARTEHIRVHTGERPYACPDCDQTFRFVSDFSRHKRNTGHTKS